MGRQGNPHTVCVWTPWLHPQICMSLQTSNYKALGPESGITIKDPLLHLNFHGPGGDVSSLLGNICLDLLEMTQSSNAPERDCPTHVLHHLFDFLHKNFETKPLHSSRKDIPQILVTFCCMSW